MNSNVANAIIVLNRLSFLLKKINRFHARSVTAVTPGGYYPPFPVDPAILRALEGQWPHPGVRLPADFREPPDRTAVCRE